MIIMYLNPHQASCDLTRRVFLLNLLTQFQPNIKKSICTIQYVKKKGFEENTYDRIKQLELFF